MTDIPALVQRLRAVACTICSQPVLGHWPHMRAGDDANELEKSADALEELDTLLYDANEAVAERDAEIVRLTKENETAWMASGQRTLERDRLQMSADALVLLGPTLHANKGQAEEILELRVEIARLLEYLKFDGTSHRDWVADCQDLEAERDRLRAE